jgi:adenosylmethionine-8-amino-7-oxononanoate aminotransferase
MSTPERPGPLLHPYARPTALSFRTIVRGEGALVWDDHGTEYVDGMASLWYANAGHGRREITEAVTAQMQRIAAYHCFDPFTNEPADAVAARLAALAPMPEARVFLTSSGSEAVDTALKLARLSHVLAGRPERTVVVSRSRGYHGVTYGGLSAQGLPANQAGYGPLLPDVVNVDGDDVEAMARTLADHGERVAAVIAEPVQGAGGVWPPPEGYLPALRRLCDRHGCLLILDEVICGFGRLGRWWGAERYGVVPDLVTFAKGVTSGYVPLGGVLVGAAVRAALEADPAYVLRHGFTYSGHPTACAAALANLDVLERDGLLERAVAVGDRLGHGLRSLHADGLVAAVRGDGAVGALALRADTDAVAVRDAMLARGVICRALPSTLTFCPPLVITDDQIDRIVDAAATALTVGGSGQPSR